jgi:hypothetical protein
MTTIATPSPLLTELADVLAKGHLRLTRTAQILGTSRAREPHKELDLRVEESPHLLRELAAGGLGGKDRAR